MKKQSIIILLLTISFLIPSFSLAIEQASRISDREVVERLTRVETRLDSIDNQTKQVRDEIKQVREDMNSQFNRIAAIFTALVVAVIGFAIWDRRSMIKPFEKKTKELEDQIINNSDKIHSLVEAFKALSKSDEKVAEVLKKFNLL